MKPLTQSILFGSLAVVLWGSLATLGNLIIHLPPFYVLGASFVLGSLLSFRRPSKMFTSWKVSVWGVLGYFFYHFFLFYSFRFAPAIEANLINYLWPMIMILLSPVFIRGSKLRVQHFLGAALSATGCAVLVWGQGADLKLENLFGYLLAFLAALTWPVYSLVKKKMKETSIEAIGGFCLGAGLLCFLTHALIEPRVVLQARDAWVIFLMGLGPFGVAFYAWDLALSKGDARVVGALSYLTPVLSTLGLVLFTKQSMDPAKGVSMLLIVGGASCGLLDFLPSKNLVK